MSDTKNASRIYPDSGDAYVSGSEASVYLKYPYGVRLQGDPSEAFGCIRDYEKFVLSGDSEKVAAEYADILSNNTTEDQLNQHGIASSEPEVSYFTSSDYTDSRVGCNDAINPYWQFNRDDDIRPLMLFPKAYMAGKSMSTNTIDAMNGIMHSCGMGRVYAETYDDNQQVVWIEAGVPRFTNLLEFYHDAADNDVAQALNAGTLYGFVTGAIKSLVSGAVFAITLPVLAPFYLSRFIDMIANDRITKYYSFQPAMTMYYETVNSMLQYVAIGIGIHPYCLKQHAVGEGASKVNADEIARSWNLNSTDSNKNFVVKKTATSENGEVLFDTIDWDATFSRSNDDNTSVYPGLPGVLKNGPDIFRILNRRAQMADMTSVSKKTTRDLLQADIAGESRNENDTFLGPDAQYEYKDNHWIKKTISTLISPILGNDVVEAAQTWFGSLKGSLFGAGDFVGFRVERGVDASESFNNTTGPTGLAQKLNGVAEQYKEERENFGNSAAERLISHGAAGAAGGNWQAVLDQLGSEAKRKLLTLTANATGFDIGSVLISGNGFLDIPEVWRSSSFSKSYSLNVQLRSRYGDPVSIFQSIYIPMLMLLALSAPRAIGTNMYTSPFLIRAFCRGMFTVPLGIVDSISITRGRDEFGWSNAFLPTCVDVRVTIKDLSPTLFLSMQDNGIFDTFTRNGNLLEYLDTLSALGLKERVYFWPKLMRKIDKTLATLRTTIFSASYWGQKIGRSATGRALNRLMMPFKTNVSNR